MLKPTGVGAQPFGGDEAAVGSLATVPAAGARSRHAIKGPSEVHDEVSRGALVSVRAGLGPARGRDAVALCRRHGRGAPVAVRTTRRAEAVLGLCDRDGVDAPPCLPVALAPSGRLFLRSVLSLLGVDLAAPDHTTLSRRSQSLAVACRRLPSRGPIHLLVDSTGLSMVGEGAWAAVNHGGRGHRGGKTLHLAVDRAGVIVAHALTEPTGDDATIGIDLMETVADEIAPVTADAAYDTVACYEAAEMRDAPGVVPPCKTARVSRRRPRSRARDRTITDVRTRGRRRWQQEAGYQLQARVEHACLRDQSMIGDRLRARSRGGRVAESVGACHVLNQMPERGRPKSYSLGR